MIDMVSTIFIATLLALQLKSTPSPVIKPEWTGSAGSRIRARVFKGVAVTPHPVLVIVLHGDAPFNKPTYQYAFARTVVDRFPEVIAAALLRPGYADDTGAKSAGNRGTATGDNYTPEVLRSLYASIVQLKSEVHPSSTIIVGHSGGAVLSADLMERYSDLAGAALLVSCPCDVAEWREHMKTISPTPLWDAPVRSVSPMNGVDSISPMARIAMVVGDSDPIAPERYTDRFALAVRNHGVNVVVTRVRGGGHEILLNDLVLKELATLMRVAR